MASVPCTNFTNKWNIWLYLSSFKEDLLARPHILTLTHLPVQLWSVYPAARPRINSSMHSKAFDSCWIAATSNGLIYRLARRLLKMCD